MTLSSSNNCPIPGNKQEIPNYQTPKNRKNENQTEIPPRRDRPVSAYFPPKKRRKTDFPNIRQTNLSQPLRTKKKKNLDKSLAIVLSTSPISLGVHPSMEGDAKGGFFRVAEEKTLPKLDTHHNARLDKGSLASVSLSLCGIINSPGKG